MGINGCSRIWLKNLNLELGMLEQEYVNMQELEKVGRGQRSLEVED
jgi:hypothetical protein